MTFPFSTEVHERYLDIIKKSLGQELEEGYEAWLRANFPNVTHSPLAERHHRLWQWFVDLGNNHQTPSEYRSASHNAPRQFPSARTPNTEHPIPPSSPIPSARVEIWPRGGAKSTSAELACTYLSTRRSRRFVLYVSATQSQADLHVQSIAGYLEHLGVERAISRYGTSRGWRRNQLRTADGFHVAAYGLDGAARGVKIGQFRPDLIIFDDIDNQTDTASTVNKKIEAITTAIIPAGSPDCAILFLQNLIHEDGVVAQLVSGRADFLHNRHVPTPDPAVRGLKVEIASASPSTPNTEHLTPPNPPAPNAYRITAGTATWQGQSIETCEKQINDWGLSAFLREAQHEVANTQGYFFDTSKFEIVEDAHGLQQVCLAWDLAATEGGGDHTVAVLMGRANSPSFPNALTPQGPTPSLIYVLHVLRVQRSSEAVRELILKWSKRIRDRFPTYTIHLPQDPGQAGKAQAESLRRLLSGFQNVRIEPVTGAKAVRASSYAEQVNLGNVKLLRGPWNADFIEEHRKFREDESHLHDDQVDTAADAFRELSTPRIGTQTSMIKTNPTYARQYSRMRPADVDDEDDED